MDMPPRLLLTARFLLLCFAALLVPGVADAQQVLSVSPNPSTPISVTATFGTNAASQTVRISNSGRAALKWTVVQPAAPWLSVSPTSGVNNGTLTLTFNTSGLAVSATPYQTTFAINSNGGSATVTVKVTIVAATAPALVANCPANKTVASPDGFPVVVTYTIPTPSGGTSPYTTSGSPSSGTSFQVGTTTVQVTAQDSSQPPQTASCSFTVTVTYSSSLVANCPTNKTVASPDGNPVVVTYTIPTPSGGTSPYTTSGLPSSGSSFSVGTTTVQVTAQDSSQPPQTATCSFTVTVTYSSPPSTGRGPQSTIQCPAGAVDILWSDTVAYIQYAINNNPGATTFCFRAGTHTINASITPKTGNTFVGEYGAILDGAGWTTTDDTQAAFRVYDDPNDPYDPNTPIDSVTIRNLVIRNMPQYGIHGSHTRSADHWTIEYNEIASNKFGVMFTRNATIRNNKIHDNVGDPTSPTPGYRGGGYVGQYADNTILDNNEIAYNGPEQKVGLSVNVTFSNNFVHHNVRDGIWYDLNNNTNAAPVAALIEGNRIEDNRGNGIVFEISIGATIRNNTFRRNGEDAVLITVSQNAQIYNNLLEANYGGIEYFLNCGSFSEGFDLRNNAAYSNTIYVSTQAYSYANGFSHLSQCTADQLLPYVNGSKNLTFSTNTYHVPDLSFTRYFLWDGWKDWTMWQALTQPGHDGDGSLVSP